MSVLLDNYSSKKLIMVDVDNTLINVHEYHYLALDQTMRSCFDIAYSDVQDEITLMQRCRPQDLTAEHPALHLSIAARKAKTSTNMALLSNAIKKYEDMLNEMIHEMPGARDFLVTCQKQEIPVVAITNNFLSISLNRLVKTDLAKFIHQIITPEVYGIPKPSRFLFQTILKDFRLTPSQTIMIGDNAITDGGCADLGIEFQLLHKDTSRTQYDTLIKRLNEK